MKSIRRATLVTIGTLLLVALPLIAFAGAGGGTQSTSTSSTAASPVPEPGALLLFAAGAVVVGAALRRTRS